MREARTERVSVVLTPSMRRRVARMAERMGLSISSLVAIAVGEWMDEREQAVAARAVRGRVQGSQGRAEPGEADP